MLKVSCRRPGPVKLAMLAVVAVTSVVHADGFAGGDQVDDYVPDPPSAPSDVGITEKLSAQVPLDAPFRDETGRTVVLGDYLRDDLPVILTFNYSNCPNLCSLQLSGLVKGISSIDLQPGRQYRIVTIDLDPLETPARIAATRASYLQRLPAARRADAERGWTFLVARVPGEGTQIRRAADAVGFRYHYLADSGQYAHPAGLIFLSSRGKVTRYVGGTDYPTDELRDSIVRAGLAEPATSAGFFLTCFHGAPTTRSRGVIAIVRIVAMTFLGLGGAGFWFARARRRRRG